MEELDPPTHLSEILDEANSLRSLARALVRDGEEADDLIQDSLLVATEQSPPAGWFPRRWLVGVIRNLSRGRRRQDARRRRAERAAAALEVDRPDPGERLARLRAVVEAVESLSEPYRTSIILRYLEGRPPREIAAEQAIPLATVKARLRRGLAELRLRLDREFGRQGWMAALTLLAWPGSASALTTSGSPLVAGGLVMKGKLVIAVIAIAILSVIAWFSFWGPGDSINETKSLETARGGPRSEPEQAPQGRGEEGAVSTSPFERAEEPTSAATEEFAGKLLRVVAEGSGTALAGARVHFLDVEKYQQTVDRSLRARFTGAPLEVGAVEESISLRTDSNGLVRLPEFEVVASVGAWAGKRWGRRFFKAHEREPLTLEIPEDIVLCVLVSGPNDAPLSGVPVCLRQHGQRHVQTVRRAVTSENGLAYFRHLQMDSLARLGKLAVGLGDPFLGGPEVQVRLEHLPDEPVRLSLSKWGRMEIEARHADGALWLQEGYVGLGAVREVTLFDRHSWWRDKLWVPLQNGRAVFPFVGLDQQFDVIVHPLHGERARGTWRGRGPVVAGAVERVSVTLGEPYPVFVGRAVDEDGNPVGTRRLRIGLGRPGQKNFPWRNVAPRTVVTDATGRFRLPADDATWRDSSRILRFTNVTQRSYMAPTMPELTAERAIPEGVGPGEVSLGNVVLRRSPLLLTAVVVDEQDRPLSDAQARLEFFKGERPGWRSAWQADTWFDRRTGADGTFAVYGPCDDGKLRIRVSREGYLIDEPTEFERGTRDLRIRMHASGELIGRVVLPAGTGANQFRVTLEGPMVPSGPDQLPGYRRIELDKDGGFRVSSLRAGVGRLVVKWEDQTRTDGRPGELVVIDNLEVRAGECTRDPRVAPLDLSSVIHKRTISVRDVGGEPVASSHVLARSSAQEYWCKFVTDSNGQADVWSSAPTVEVRVDKPGFRREVVPSVSGDCTVTLSSGFPIEVLLDDGAPKVPQLYQLAVVILESGPPPAPNSRPMWREVARAPLGRDHRVVVRAPAPGAYRLEVRVERVAERIGRWGQRVVAEEIKVGRDEKAQVGLTVTEESLSLATERLERTVERLTRRR